MTDAGIGRRGRRRARGRRRPVARRGPAGEHPRRGRGVLRGAAVRDGPGPGRDRRAAGQRRAQVARHRGHDGTLAGVSVQPVPELAVAGSDGVTILGSTGAVTAKVAIDGGAHGLALVSGVDDGTQLYVSSQDTSKDPQLVDHRRVRDRGQGGPRRHRHDADARRRDEGRVRRGVARWSRSSARRRTARGAPCTSSRPHGKSVFADQRVPFAPVGLGARPQRGLPDRQPRPAADLRLGRRDRHRSTSGTTRSRGGCPA